MKLDTSHMKQKKTIRKTSKTFGCLACDGTVKVLYEFDGNESKPSVEKCNLCKKQYPVNELNQLKPLTLGTDY